MKYTSQPPGNSLDGLGTPQNPYFDSSHIKILQILQKLSLAGLKTTLRGNSATFIMRQEYFYEISPEKLFKYVKDFFILV